MNQGDSEIILGDLKEKGHEIVEEPHESELVIVNTCAVTRTTLNKVIHRLRELKNSDKKVVVAGCLPLIDKEKVDNIGEFEAVISCLTTDSIGEIVNRVENGESGIEKIRGESKKLSKPRHREDEISSPVPIAEGCVSNCSYCCVKSARGNLRSFESREIVAEIEQEVRKGRKEIYVTAQDTGAYGFDIGTDLASLLEKISAIPLDFRVRVGMMNPEQAKQILSNLLEAYNSEKIYKFLHLPVQSGSDEILEKMRRNYSVDDFRKVVNGFREKYPDIFLSTDIIAGFPGETEEEFRKSCRLMEEVKPDKINITRFTPMPGTDAKEMDQIDSEIKKKRSKKLTKIQKKISEEQNKKQIGKELDGLVIKKGKKGGYMVRAQNYRPIIVDDASPGDFVKVKIKDAKSTYLKGKILEEKK